MEGRKLKARVRSGRSQLWLPVTVVQWDLEGQEAEAFQTSLALPDWGQMTDSALGPLPLNTFFDL